MNDVTALAELEDLREVMANGGYECRIGPLGVFSRVLLAENPYALLAALETETWEGLVELVSEVQAELTQLALRSDRKAIRWDLYVLVHVRMPGLQAVESVLLDRVESDTKYARKFVRINLTRNPAVLDQALRPFLPLRSASALQVADPFDLLKAELVDQGLDDDLVDHAVEHFRSTGEVSVL